MEGEILRRTLVRIGALLYDRRYVVAAEGNLSARLGDDRFLVTPAGACKGWLAPESLLEIAISGRPVGRGRSGTATSEWRLHREIYERCPDARAVCHAHPPYATACAAAGRALDGRVLIESEALLGTAPLVRFATAGTEDLAVAVREHLPAARAMLLSNHGAVAWGADIHEAYFRLEYLERLAEVTLLGELAGGARPMPGSERFSD